ncbi:TPA: nucleotidyl transferase AbiEii/AbiGii toxin family protein [Legionella pneumophila]
MNISFLDIINASPEDRKGLFLSTANRLGTSLKNVEKDFWVCWILDLIFNGRNEDEPRLLFKGGTSLSKAYSLISRFSEDIDITVFREDLGLDIEVKDLEKLSGKQQRIRLEKIQQACQVYIQGEFRDRLHQQIKTVFQEAGVKLNEPYIVPDPTDAQKQTLLLHYPSVDVSLDDYVKPSVKIEAGAKSALDPHCLVACQPYIAAEVPQNLFVQNVVTIEPARTFWDKVIILHGIRCWYDNRGELRQNGHRVSRHYYDIYQLMQSKIGREAQKDHNLAIDCARHAQLFFNSSDLNLKYARPGSFILMPTPEMHQVLNRDYQAMAGMIFGQVPKFSDVLDVVAMLEKTINSYKI